MSDETTRSLTRLAESGSPADLARSLVARLRVAPRCEACAPEHLPKGTKPNHVLEDIRPFNGGTRPAFTARVVPCPSCAGTGSPLRARLELAAYCGSEAARLALGPRACLPLCFGPNAAGESVHAEGCPAWWHDRAAFPLWLSGLSRWVNIGPVPGWVSVRAAVAAARVALDAHPDAPGKAPRGTWPRSPLAGLERAEAYNAPRRAIEAAEAWLACPCERHSQACAGVGAAHNLPEGFYELVEMVTLDYTHGGSDVVGLGGVAHHAASLLRDNGETLVRRAISEALVEWALT